MEVTDCYLDYMNEIFSFEMAKVLVTNGRLCPSCYETYIVEVKKKEQVVQIKLQRIQELINTRIEDREKIISGKDYLEVYNIENHEEVIRRLATDIANTDIYRVVFTKPLKGH
jgi:hypothetical protein